MPANGCLVCGGDCSPWPYSLFAFDRKQIEPFCSRVCLNEFAAQYDGISE